MSLAFKIGCFDLQAVYIRWCAHRSRAHTQSDVNDAGGADALSLVSFDPQEIVEETDLSSLKNWTRRVLCRLLI